ncbi:hypothetical protein KIMH_15370 [Bombiscardovia apis]|uniref:Uncharacterized protein n=1 Tax=Bombiscardovia apis TaxID=2932182 RepID=A0ABM8BET8_9BIFI|nr:hypothetical protein KIMH_15370 [Bombiscardovia apis]
MGLPQTHANPASGDGVYPAADAHKSASGRNRDQSGIKLTLRSSTAVVSKTSGYTVKVAITNTSDQASGAGTLSVDTNALYTFSSRIDMQDWADGGSHIPTPNHLVSQHVDSIQPGQSLEVTASAAADQEQLAAMNTWGPKPLLLTYSNDKATDSGKPLLGEATTFLTRSSDGLTTAQTPPMSISMLLPLASTGWSLDQDKVKQLMTGQQNNKQSSKSEKESTENHSQQTPSASASNSQSASRCQPTQCTVDSQQDNSQSKNSRAEIATQTQKVVNLSQSAIKQQEHQIQLLEHHNKLNTLADPLYVGYFNSHVRVDAGMQPGAFDMSTYSNQDAAHYNSAGVEDEDWNAQTASHELQDSLGDNTDTKPVYALQGHTSWSLDSLTQARKQGYTTAVAPLGLDADSGTSAHTSKYTVPTDAGEITVLSAQQELSTLAQGEPTSAKAASEQSTAGQVARFMAQSAFYQMEQPYAERALLVCFGNNQDTGAASMLMDAVEAASWLQLDNLDTLAKAQPYAKGDQARELIAQESKNGSDKSKAGSLDGTLDSLTASRKDIERFGTAMLAKPKQTNSSPSASSGKSDAQALARQDATDTARRSDDPREWLQSVTQVHDTLALHALSCADKAGGLADAARTLADQLLNGVQIKPSESVTIVSETAKMPVTLSNSHPYPVAVRVSSKTDSMEIVTTRTAYAVIPANSETQVTFTIRVATAGQADAEIALVDQDGVPFGQTRSTHITSNLRLSDMSGLLIVVLALLFGALGLWRQFTRKKDPDE